ncbi:MAG: UDP-N-acetylmuramoyl-L-alanyl-D-glutamate--2,6-diaminopimelate ligase [Bacteroidota bacterium]
MANIQHILYQVPLLQTMGNLDREIRQLQIDSRQVQPGDLFIAVRGSHMDGHAFIPAAIAAGAVAIVCETFPPITPEGITFIQVKEAGEALGRMAHHFYGDPSEQITLVGVTGTNGKTTIATLLFRLFSSMGYHCGLISTVQNQIGEEVLPSTHTTPDAIKLNELLHRMCQSGCTYVFMECSSHAIHQHRITGLRFVGAIFSNITHDHLDYHKTFDEYIRVKKSFFDQLPASAFALSNADDKRGQVMLQNTKAIRRIYSLHQPADFKGKILENALTGLVMLVNDVQVHFRLIGEFNAYNLLAVYGAGCLLGQEPAQVLTHLSALTGAEGRFDYQVSATGIIGIIDYAHTPDAVENVLTTIRQLRKGNESIITVVGCGGDRYKTKRPLMAQIAVQYSNRVILTSDNPRTEDPAAILQDMQSGLAAADGRKYLTVSDRKEAIKTAVTLAQAGDIILVAGKGHEKYQEIKGVKHPFDDKQVLGETFQLLHK